MTIVRRTASRVILTALLLLMTLSGRLEADGPAATWRNSLDMTFVLIPAGSFTMGSPPKEPFRDESEPAHPVAITRPFYMQTTEVTLAQWRALMGTGFLLRWSGPADYPATSLSWHDTQKFLAKLNARGEGLYRLPTEAEWEYAARAGSTTAYSWGERIDCSRAMYANSQYGASTCMDQLPRWPQDGPAPVKSYAPNAWGLYDMHGNVWEWVQDWFAPYPGSRRTDPQGPRTGIHRVRRGGSWYGPGYACRSANRAYSHPATREITTGFRVVRVIEP